MKTIQHYIDKGAQYWGYMHPSDRYRQGIDLGDHPGKVDSLHPAVYILTCPEGEVLKIGQTSNIWDRMFKQYKCTTNTTNNKVRDKVKEPGKMVIYAFPVSPILASAYGYSLKTSLAEPLEHQLLREYKANCPESTLPVLNTMCR